jgi:UPF0755 protein
MKKFFIIFTLFLVLFFLYFSFIKAPRNKSFPVSITYKQGDKLNVFLNLLEENKIVRNKNVFKYLLIFSNIDKNIKPNVYVFEKPLNIFQLLERVNEESNSFKGIKVTVPEGFTVSEIKSLVYKFFPNFSKSENNSFLVKDEGYLFPETYFFNINATEEEIISEMKNTFNEKTESLFLNKSEKEIKDIIIMASILEKEGKTKEEREVISGILWKRLRENMPLQVDATFLYTKGKGTSELTIDDLKSDDLYNTYTKVGLPIAPINNPGLETIKASLNPKESPYYFYLHDSDGQVHYAKNFTEHKKNKSLYLK